MVKAIESNTICPDRNRRFREGDTGCCYLPF